MSPRRPDKTVANASKSMVFPPFPIAFSPFPIANHPFAIADPPNAIANPLIAFIFYRETKSFFAYEINTAPASQLSNPINYN